MREILQMRQNSYKKVPSLTETSQVATGVQKLSEVEQKLKTKIKQEERNSSLNQVSFIHNNISHKIESK